MLYSIMCHHGTVCAIVIVDIGISLMKNGTYHASGLKGRIRQKL